MAVRVLSGKTIILDVHLILISYQGGAWGSSDTYSVHIGQMQRGSLQAVRALSIILVGHLILIS